MSRRWTTSCRVDVLLFFPYIRDSVPRLDQRNLSLLDEELMHLSLLILNVFSTELYAKIIVFPFRKTQISRESLIAQASPFSVSCDFVGRVQLEKRTEASATPLYASASGCGVCTTQGTDGESPLNTSGTYGFNPFHSRWKFSISYEIYRNSVPTLNPFLSSIIIPWATTSW